MRTEIEALKEIRDRISYFCSRTDGKYDPPWAQEVIDIIDDVLLTPYRQCKRFGAPFYVEVGTSIVAIRCASNHDVVWQADHAIRGRATIDWAKSMCTRMNQEAHKRELSKNASKNGADFGQLGDAAKLREALITIRDKAYEQYVNDNGIDTVWIQDVANAALAAPARNCDKYATADEALKAQEQMFNDSNFANGECKLGCPECDNPRVGCKIAWLFAPATEKEGGAK